MKGNPFRTAKVKEWREKNQLSQSRTRPGRLTLRGRQRNQKEWSKGKALPRKTQTIAAREGKGGIRTLRLEVWMTPKNKGIPSPKSGRTTEG